MNNISIKRAATINAISKYSIVIYNLFISAILARILVPEEFGIVTVTSVFTNFFAILADMGIGTAIIQRKDLSNDDINSIFSFTVITGIVLQIMFCLLSIPMSIIYSNDIYIPIGIILSFALFFNTVNMVPNALLLKNKKFVMVAARTISVTVFSSIIAVVLAANGFGCYALVIQSVISSISLFIWNYNCTRPKIVRKIEGESIKKIRGYSAFQFLFNFINYFARNTDNLLIGAFMGESALGYYDKSYKLSLYPVNNLTHAITPVIHPILSDYQDDKERIYNEFVKVVKVLSLLGVFIMAFCFFASQELITIIFGMQWKDSIPCFQMLSLSIWAQMISAATGSAFQSVGDTKTMFKSGCITSAVTVVSILLGVLQGDIIYISINVAIAYNINFFVVYYNLIKKSMGINMHKFIRIIIPDIFILFVLFFVGFLVSYVLGQMNLGSIIMDSIIKLMVLAAVYMVLLFMTRQNNYIFGFVKRRK